MCHQSQTNLLVGKSVDGFAEAIVGQDLAKKVAAGEVSLKAVDLVVDQEGFLAWRTVGSSEPLQNLILVLSHSKVVFFLNLYLFNYTDK